MDIFKSEYISINKFLETNYPRGRAIGGISLVSFWPKGTKNEICLFHLTQNCYGSFDLSSKVGGVEAETSWLCREELLD